MVSLPKPGVYDKNSIGALDLIRNFLSLCSNGESGATLFFIGIARKTGKKEINVKYIEMESYVEHANNAILKICEEIKRKYSLNEIYIWHFIGKFEVGEPLVIVAVSAKHREEAIDGLKEAVERYKREPALFKKEVYEDMSALWIEGA
ncbi:MAG: molybdenum cofactor biosynthesis protein MoaE [Thermoproteota archaeon]|jgi:Molybdopterin converting factor, large subunit